MNIIKTTKKGRVIVYSDEGFEEAFKYANEHGYPYWVWNGFTKSGKYWIELSKGSHKEVKND